MKFDVQRPRNPSTVHYSSLRGHTRTHPHASRGLCATTLAGWQRKATIGTTYNGVEYSRKLSPTLANAHVTRLTFFFYRGSSQQCPSEAVVSAVAESFYRGLRQEIGRKFSQSRATVGRTFQTPLPPWLNPQAVVRAREKRSGTLTSSESTPTSLLL